MGLLLDHRQQGKARLLVLNVIDISTILMIYNYFYNKCIFLRLFPRIFPYPALRHALCDFINRQERGEIPETLIDFSSPQNVLVFDLGGGTLDVSFHQVRRSDGGNGNVEVKDYAISRYTQRRQIGRASCRERV